MRGASRSLAKVLLVGESDAVGHIDRLIDQVADSDCPALVEGESGTGKELVARLLHLRSPRHAEPFIPVNCAGVGEGVFESQFFGHVRGAFTGAEQSMLGLVRAANGGTLFLDEVGEIPVQMQAKLLRVLQEGEVLPVGATRTERVNTRFVAATNCDLRQCVQEGTFRKDLYYRLNIVRIHIPPLRERPEDVEPLLRHFLDRCSRRYNRPAVHVPPPVVRALCNHSWPGNVRELAAWVERLFVTRLSPERLTAELVQDRAEPARDLRGLREMPPEYLDLKALEEWAIRKALELTGGNLKEAARILRIHRTTLWRKRQEYKIP